MLTTLLRRIILASRIIGRKTSFWLSLVIIAGLLLAFVEAQLAIFIQLFLKNLGVNIEVSTSFLSVLNDTYTMRELMIVLVCIGVIRGIGQFIVNQSATISLETINARLRLLSLYELLMNRQNRYVSASATNARFGEIIPKTAIFFYYLAQSVPQAVLSIILVSLLFTISPYAATIAFVGLGLVGLLMIAINKNVQRFAKKVPKEQEQLMAGVERVTRNWLLIKVLRTHEAENQRLSGNVLNYAIQSIRANSVANLGAAAPQIFGILLLVVIVIFSQEVLHSPSSVIISFLYLFLRLVQTLSTFATQSTSISVYFPQARAAANYFTQFPPEELAEASKLMNNIPVFRVQKTAPLSEDSIRTTHQDLPAPHIEVKDISFGFNDSMNVFKSFSLHVKSGEHIGIVGKSGGGKSTLLGIILGVLRVPDGSVKISGLPAEEFLNQNSERIGFVSAEPLLIEGSIKDNIRYGLKFEPTDQEYEQVLQAASMTEFIKELPDGLEHKINESGAGLSAGQKQRLGLARALIRKPVLLILDEISANLDVETERKIAESILRYKNTTVIIVSHRPEALKHVDRVITLSSLPAPVTSA